MPVDAKVSHLGSRNGKSYRKFSGLTMNAMSWTKPPFSGFRLATGKLAADYALVILPEVRRPAVPASGGDTGPVTATAPREWDAQAYDALPLPHERWGQQSADRVVVLGGHLDRLPAAEHDAFVAAVADRLDEPVVDYVRLQFAARRG
jgi:hypothetical protein